jgi:hypothetical protein
MGQAISPDTNDLTCRSNQTVSDGDRAPKAIPEDFMLLHKCNAMTPHRDSYWRFQRIPCRCTNAMQ